MDKNKYKLLDAFFVWGLCLLIFGIAGNLLSGTIGIWAYYLCELASVGVVLWVSHKTGLKKKLLFSMGEASLPLTAGAALIWAAALLISVPLFLFSHLLVPNFATVCFHIYDYTSSHWAVAGLILLTAVAETLLFDGFLYQRVKGLSVKWLVPVILGAAYGLYHLDLYVLLPLTLAGIAISYVRVRSDGVGLTFVLRLITVSVTLAYMQVSDSTDSLAGSSMGVLQVVGFTMILLGAAVPSLALGSNLLGDWKARNIFEKFMVVAISIVMIASGCGISTL